MAYNTVRKRTADAVVKIYDTLNDSLDKSDGNGFKKSDTIGFEFSRSNLANMVGTATESVIRVLSEFKKDGLLDIDGSQIIIKDINGIKAIKH